MVLTMDNSNLSLHDRLCCQHIDGAHSRKEVKRRPITAAAER